MFGRSAEHACERTAKGDNFIAEGYTRTVNYEREDGQAVESEEFVAKKIGHDAARTRYEVDRSPRMSINREIPSFESPAYSTPAASASGLAL